MSERIVPHSCLIDFNVDDTANSIVMLLKRIQSVTQAIEYDQAISPSIDFSLCQYLGPSAAALVGALVMHRREMGKDLRVVLPTSPPKLNSFCTFSGLRLLLEQGPAPDIDHPECETVPITVIRGEPGRHAERVIRLVKRHVDLTTDAEEYLSIAINEVLQNVADHANSPIGCVLCARYIASQNEVRVAIVDRGDTIPEVLWRKHPELQPSIKAIRAVLQGGYSTKSRINNMGQGISNIANFVRSEEGKGRLTIVSRDTSASVHHKRKTESESPSQLWFHGTAVFFTMKLYKSRQS